MKKHRYNFYNLIKMINALKKNQNLKIIPMWFFKYFFQSNVEYLFIVLGKHEFLELFLS